MMWIKFNRCSEINKLGRSIKLAHDMHCTMARVDYDKAGSNVGV